MARKPRLHVPGGVYHVILRGNGGQDIFFDDEDLHHVYGLLHQGVERYRHRIHGFCCMTNHLHFATSAPERIKRSPFILLSFFFLVLTPAPLYLVHFLPLT